MKKDFNDTRRLAIQLAQNFHRGATIKTETTERSAINAARADLGIWRVAISRAVKKGNMQVSMNSNWVLNGGGINNGKSVPGFDSMKFFNRSTSFREVYMKELEELLGEPFRVRHVYHACDDEGFTSPPHYSFSVSWFGL